MCNYRSETDQGQTHTKENSIAEIGNDKVRKSNHRLKVDARVSRQKRFLRHENLDFSSYSNSTRF